MKPQDPQDRQWWTLVSWLLAATFLGTSHFYAVQGSAFGWAIWLVLGAVWLEIALRGTTKYLKNRNRER